MIFKNVCFQRYIVNKSRDLMAVESVVLTCRYIIYKGVMKLPTTFGFVKSGKLLQKMNSVEYSKKKSVMEYRFS